MNQGTLYHVVYQVPAEGGCWIWFGAGVALGIVIGAVIGIVCYHLWKAVDLARKLRQSNRNR